MLSSLNSNDNTFEMSTASLLDKCILNLDIGHDIQDGNLNGNVDIAVPIIFTLTITKMEVNMILDQAYQRKKAESIKCANLKNK